MNFSFSYSFKTSTSSELYQILYASPALKGLVLLKDALWDTFDGREFYQNSILMPGQTSLFSTEFEKETRLEYYANEAKEMLTKEFAGREVTYNEIEIFLVENTMLKSTQIITPVLKPLISNSIVKKQNIRSIYA